MIRKFRNDGTRRGYLHDRDLANDQRDLYWITRGFNPYDPPPRPDPVIPARHHFTHDEAKARVLKEHDDALETFGFKNAFGFAVLDAMDVTRLDPSAPDDMFYKLSAVHKNVHDVSQITRSDAIDAIHHIDADLARVQVRASPGTAGALEALAIVLEEYLENQKPV